jgi:hypothetical protein
MKELNDKGLIGLLYLRELIRGKIVEDQNCAIITVVDKGYQVQFVHRNEIDDTLILGEINYEHCAKAMES